MDFRDGVSRQLGDRARAVIVATMALAGTIGFGAIVNAHYPIADWFAWRWFLLLAYTAFFQIACVTVGSRVLARIVGDRPLPLLESWLAAMGLGLIGFVTAMYVAGALALFVTPVAVGLPLVMIAIGYRSGIALLRRTAAEWPSEPPATLAGRAWRAALLLFGCVGVLLIYGIGFSPDAISFDAQWYHLPIAQDYARTGRIFAFPGDYNRSFPHLSSIVYTWGWLMPGMSAPLSWMMALHLEFAMVLWKLVGISALAQWMLADSGTSNGRRGLWVGLMLFPAIFAFGNTVGGGAEHFLAFWAAPMLTSTVRLLEDDFDPRHAILLGCFAGGATSTKYQAIYMVAACGTLIAARWVVVLVAHRRAKSFPPGLARRLWLAPLLVIAFTCLTSAPHFIKNLVLYANPLYPFAQDQFGGTPTHDQAAELWRTMLGEEANHPKATGAGRLWWTFQIFATFSFVPHYTVGWVKDWPLFGSLFTLLAPCGLLLRRSGRIWVGIWCGFVVIAVWGNTYLTDRYLNAAVPIFAATTVALLVRLWELGTIARIGLAPLVALQLVWSGDAAMYSGEKLLGKTMEIWASGWNKRTDDDVRLARFEDFIKVTEALPPDARVLLRGSRPSLGLDREVWLDLQWGQAGLFYEPIHDAAGLWQLYRDRGITHLVWRRDVHYSGTLQSSILFAELIDASGAERKRVGGYDIVALPSEPPPASEPVTVLALQQRLYKNGLYNVEDLHVFGRHSPTERKHVAPRVPVDTKDDDAVIAALGRADVVAAAKPVRLEGRARRALERAFHRFETVDKVEIWLRKR
jgi:hypothetical protein